MNTSKRGLCIWGFLLFLCGLSQGYPAIARADAGENPHQDIEAKLLHTALSLRELQLFSVRRGTWQGGAVTRMPARVRVVSLWSLRCQPCVDELPALTELAARYQQGGEDVEFLFVADPPEESPRQEVEAFWRDPFVDRLADRCEASKLGDLRQRDGRRSCRLDLHGIDAARSSQEAGFLSLREVSVRPLTLLVDPQGTVRQVFVGSLLRRIDLLRDSIERLRLRLRAQTGGPVAKHGN